MAPPLPGRSGGCFCGCGDRAVHRHHVVYQQHIIRAVGRAETVRRKLLLDPRNLVDVALICHGAHHNTVQKYEVGRLPDSVFVFAAELLGPGGAFEYIARRYEGTDSRLDALLAEWEAAA